MTTDTNKPADTRAWYQQFWPWFLIILPASVVVASMVTIWLALDRPHHMVVDDYYKEGKAINQSLAKSELARKLGLAANLRLLAAGEGDTEQLEIRLLGTSTPPDSLQLNLVHPANSQLDISLELEADADGLYRMQQQLPRQRWYIQLSGSQAGAAWRLQGEVDFSVRHQALLEP